MRFFKMELEPNWLSFKLSTEIRLGYHSNYQLKPDRLNYSFTGSDCSNVFQDNQV